MGCVSPIGTTAGELLDGLRSGVLGVRPAPWTDGSPGSALFASVTDRFDPAAFLAGPLLSGTDCFVQFGLAACAEALAAAGLGDGTRPLDPLRTAVVDGTSMG